MKKRKEAVVGKAASNTQTSRLSLGHRGGGGKVMVGACIDTHTDRQPSTQMSFGTEEEAEQWVWAAEGKEREDITLGLL